MNREKIKKIILITVVVIASIFLLLFAIELIDKKVNGEMYAKIDKFLKEESKEMEEGSGKICSEKIDYILKNTYEKLQKNEGVITNEFKNSYIYNNTIKHCKLSLNSFSNLIPPSNIREDKAILLKQTHEYKKYLMGLNIDMLEEIKFCNGNETCLIENKKLLNTAMEANEISIRTMLSQSQTKKRLSVKYMVFGDIGELVFKNLIKKASNLRKEI